MDRTGFYFVVFLVSFILEFFMGLQISSPGNKILLKQSFLPVLADSSKDVMLGIWIPLHFVVNPLFALVIIALCTKNIIQSLIHKIYERRMLLANVIYISVLSLYLYFGVYEFLDSSEYIYDKLEGLLSDTGNTNTYRLYVR